MLLCILSTIYRQYDYMLNKDLGYKYKDVAYIEIPQRSDSTFTLAREIEKLPCVESTSTAYSLFFEKQSGNNVMLPGDPKQLFNYACLYWAEPSIVKTMGLTVVQGRIPEQRTRPGWEPEAIVDEKFAKNFYQAREYGFTRGAYHFYSTKSTARAQADFFISKVRLETGDLPPVLDVEHKPKGQTDEEFRKSVLEWLNIVEKHYGVKPIIYTYYKFKTRYLGDPVFDSYPYWIAHYYVSEIEYDGPWKFWQHTDAGQLAGIKGRVDFDIYNGSYYDLRKLTIGAVEQIGEEAYSY